MCWLSWAFALHFISRGTDLVPRIRCHPYSGAEPTYMAFISLLIIGLREFTRVRLHLGGTFPGRITKEPVSL